MVMTVAKEDPGCVLVVLVGGESPGCGGAWLSSGGRGGFWLCSCGWGGFWLWLVSPLIWLSQFIAALPV